tara:strand:+ start:931 stop:1908 length:978 start_codon:yes stop_codon:yes gene_type:complete
MTMSDNTVDQAPTEANETLDRKELLSQQFEEAEANNGRDESGRFAKTTVQEEAPAPEPAEEPVWKRPPLSWKKDYHEVWQKADPRLQEYAFQREEQMRRGVEPLLQAKQFADSMQEVISPYMTTLNGLGMKPEQAISALLKADHTLRTSDPQTRLNYFMQLAGEYGVNLQGMPQGQQQAVDPTIFALKNELANVRGEVTTWKQQQEAAEQAVLANEIEGFAQKAEYFEEARPEMIKLLQSGVAETLEDAYDRAIYGNRDLRERVLSAQQAQQNAQIAAEKNRAAKAARAAAVSVRSATPGANTAPKANDRRALLEQAFEDNDARL